MCDCAECHGAPVLSMFCGGGPTLRSHSLPCHKALLRPNRKEAHVMYAEMFSAGCRGGIYPGLYVGGEGDNPLCTR